MKNVLTPPSPHFILFNSNDRVRKLIKKDICYIKQSQKSAVTGVVHILNILYLLSVFSFLLQMDMWSHGSRDMLPCDCISVLPDFGNDN